MPINHLLTDKRIQKQALAQGLLTRAELDEHLRALPDLRGQVATSEEDDSPRERTSFPDD